MSMMISPAAAPSRALTSEQFGLVALGLGVWKEQDPAVAAFGVWGRKGRAGQTQAGQGGGAWRQCSMDRSGSTVRGMMAQKEASSSGQAPWGRHSVHPVQAKPWRAHPLSQAGTRKRGCWYSTPSPAATRSLQRSSPPCWGQYASRRSSWGAAALACGLACCWGGPVRGEAGCDAYAYTCSRITPAGSGTRGLLGSSTQTAGATPKSWGVDPGSCLLAVSCGLGEQGCAAVLAG